MNKLMYIAIATAGLVLGATMLTHTMSPATATVPTPADVAGLDIGALHSRLDGRTLPSGALDDGIYH